MKIQDTKYRLLIRSLARQICLSLRLVRNPSSGKDSRQAGMTVDVFLLIASFVSFALCTFNSSLSYADDKGPPISIELRDVDLSDVLRALGQEHGINIIVDEKITGKVTVSLRNIPLWDAIDSILKGKGYAYIKEGDIVRIAPLIEDEDLITRTINVKYANPKDIEPLIKKVLSKRGSVALALDPKTGVSSTSIGGGSTDTRGVIIARNSMIVIKDIPSAIERAEQLLKQLDVKTRQIMIEAKIVEVNTNAREELGIQWGGMYRSGGDAWIHGGGLTSQTAAVPSTGTGITSTTGSGATALTGGIGSGGSALNVNMPADLILRGAGGAIGIGILANKLTLDLQISALEQQGNAKTLSSPKVMVMDNQDATIVSGEKITIRTSIPTTSGVPTLGTAEKEATLRLTVTPHVIDNEQISLAISTKKDVFDWTHKVDEIPSIFSRESQTGVIVKNGETIVIGGIYTENEFEGENGVPLLSRIPLLGWLFKKETKTKDKTELLIFITPRIKTEEI